MEVLYKIREVWNRWFQVYIFVLHCEDETRNIKYFTSDKRLAIDLMAEAIKIFKFKKAWIEQIKVEDFYSDKGEK